VRIIQIFDQYPDQAGPACIHHPRGEVRAVAEFFDRLHHLPPDFGADPAFAAQSVGDRAFRDSQMVRNVCDRHVIAHCFPVSLLFIKPV